LINFTALLGWHPKEDEEIMSLETIVQKFRPEDIGVSPAVFDVDKLDYFNGYYIRQMKIDQLTELCLPYLKENLDKAQDPAKKEKEYLKKVVGLEQERLKKLSEIAELSDFLFIEEPDYEKDLLIWKKMEESEVKENLKELENLLTDLPEESWEAKLLEEKIVTHIKEKEAKVGNYLWPLRVALTGKSQSPGPFEIAWTLGKQNSLKRIRKALKKFS